MQRNNPLVILYTIVCTILEETKLRTYLALSISVLILGVIASITVPLIFKLLIDSLINKDKSMLFVMSYGLIWMLSQISISLRAFLMRSIEERSSKLLIQKIIYKFCNLPLQYHYEHSTGEHINILQRTQHNVPLLIWGSLFCIVPVIIEFIAVTFIFIRWYPLQYSSILLITISLFLTYTMFMSKQASAAHHNAIKQQKETASIIVDWLSHYELVKIFGRTSYVLKTINYTLSKRELTEVKALKFYDLIYIGQSFILGMGLISLSLVISNAVAAGLLTPGDFVMLNGYLIQFMTPLSILGHVFRDTKKAFLELKDTFKIINLVSEKSIQGNYTRITKPIKIIFDQVSFNYPMKKSILKNLSFTIEHGQTVAIVGPNGVGKSTIIRLLLGLYKPTTGRIYLNTIPLHTIPQKELYQHIGIMTQETFLFRGTLKENILFARPDTSEMELKNILNQAQLFSLIDKLPDGLNTCIGERGVMLSGGEKQRIGLARLFLRKPSIALFDEPTAALDITSEKNIIKNIMNLKNRTKIIVTHKPNLLKQADIIIDLTNLKTKFIKKNYLESSQVF